MPMMRAPEDPPHWDELTAQGKERPEPEGHGAAGQAAGRRTPGPGMPWGLREGLEGKQAPGEGDGQ